MPNSTSDMDAVVKSFIASYPCSAYLDIGCGSGKYARLIRHIHPKSIITGVEVSAEYIKQFDLRSLYDRIIQVDATSIAGTTGYYTETAILGDVLEHFRKSDGIDLIDFMLYRCKYLLIVVPDMRVQYSPAAPNEEHRSLWYFSDFDERLIQQPAHIAGKSFYALRGLLSSERAYIPPDAIEILAKHGIKIGI